MTTKEQSLSLASNGCVDNTLDHRLILYALAAGATLAWCVPSQAEVIFTPSNAILSGNAKLAIDLDHDGTADFTVVTGLCVSFSGYGTVGCIRGYGASSRKQIAVSGIRAAAFPRAAIVGPFKPFVVRALMGTWYNSDQNGDWVRTANRFLGVRLKINGETHYGWIGFRSVYGTPLSLTAKLAGWAYESSPDTPLVTGRSGTGTRDAFQPTSLEILAAGHSAISQRRKRTTSAGGH